MKASLNIDLHTHSCRSDGCFTPAELVTRASAAGIEVLALTDHDTVSGLADAGCRAAELGLALVPGVEISASWRAQAVHVLGLWIDPASDALCRELGAQADRRWVRMQSLCARLSELGLPGASLLAAVRAQPGLPTRTHLARALVDAGHAKDAKDAFRKYLHRGRAAHLNADWPSLATVIEWIRAAGGVASLAHLARYGLSAGARRQLLADFAGAGGTALEVISGNNTAEQIDSCARLAAEFGLEGSIGSDFHDPKLPWNLLGRLAKLPDCVTPVWRSHGL